MEQIQKVISADQFHGQFSSFLGLPPDVHCLDEGTLDGLPPEYNRSAAVSSGKEVISIDDEILPCSSNVSCKEDLGAQRYKTVRHSIHIRLHFFFFFHEILWPVSRGLTHKSFRRCFHAKFTPHLST